MKGKCRRSMRLYLRMAIFGWFILFSFSLQSRIYASGVVSAKEIRITFTDHSGKYLKKHGSDWYLYTAEKKSLRGIQYVSVPPSGDLSSGFYMFDKNGRLAQKKSVYQFEKKTVSGVTFHGFYCTNAKGRFPTEGNILSYLSHIKCGGKTFTGYYYLGKYGKLSVSARVRRLNGLKCGKAVFHGYYYFHKYGRLCTKAEFHKLNRTIGNRVFCGTYYFGGKNGRLTTQKGWVTVKKQKYYINADGKMAANCWKSGYYLQKDGTIARCKRLSRKVYVGYDGRKYASPNASLYTLRSQIQKMIQGYRGSWSVYVKDLNTGGVINLNETPMYPASTIKAFVMAATYDRINCGKLAYSSVIRTLLVNMITVSDNESYNALVRSNSSMGNFAQGAAEINAYLKKNGYKNTGCHNTLHPASSSPANDGSRNISSAKDCGLLLEDIYNGTCVSKRYSKEMLELLSQQTRRWKIPSGVPSGVKVANKTGETSDVQHDMAIVFGPKTDYIICIFSSGVGEQNGVMGGCNISRQVYNYLNQ